MYLIVSLYLTQELHGKFPVVIKNQHGGNKFSHLVLFVACPYNLWEIICKLRTKIKFLLLIMKFCNVLILAIKVFCICMTISIYIGHFIGMSKHEIANTLYFTLSLQFYIIIYCNQFIIVYYYGLYGYS